MKEDKNSGVGFSLALAIIVVGIVLPIVFKQTLITTVFSVVLVSVGVAGLGIELESFDNGKGFASIGIGILFLVPAISLFFINSTLIKIVGVLLLLIGVFGTFVGVSEQITVRNSKKTTKEVTKEIKSTDKSISKGMIPNVKILFFILGALAGFIANLVTILDYLKIR
ncbi:hypothetical protein BW731_10690 [Vagococcus martis]|uniref:Uncharacterized protein n=1 Tax=Vagococcus martis TaxID=1768210 RepID=A0A1V4DK64_9ENTE|nr:hypothetical protein [Vagococcus martis]OPF88600.1 hypothetical protein BW731_10690 [Vagococcus martis]